MSVNDDECRLGYYQVASILLLKPSIENLKEALKVIEELLENGCSAVEPELLEELKQAILESREDLRGLEVEYTRLFVNAYPKLECPPYETVFRERKRSIMGKHALDIAKIIEELGLEVSQDFKEPPEHVTLEFEIMVYLIYNTLRETGRMDLYCLQWRVFGDHISKWVPEYADCLGNAAKLSLYKVLADYLKKLVETEEKALSGYAEVCGQ
ncbi:MAG: hypothetical protein DRJ35_07315 [Thermoprotei archaeon]|nr:MAG: hypothetical protein DRJ35_07315 [Thermoprotei archaeon]